MIRESGWYLIEDEYDLTRYVLCWDSVDSCWYASGNNKKLDPVSVRNNGKYISEHPLNEIGDIQMVQFTNL